MKRFFLTIAIISLFSCSNNKQNFILLIEDGSGLEESTKVLFKGQEIGEINKMYFDKTNLIAEISIPHDFQVYTDTEFNIISTNIIGSKAIEVVHTGKGDVFQPSNHDTIFCKKQPSMHDLLIKEIINTTKSVMDTIQQNN